MNDTRETTATVKQDSARDLLLLACGILPSLVMGVQWMLQSGIPAAVYVQNIVAAIVGAIIAVYGKSRRVSPARGLVVTMCALVLLLGTFVAGGVQGVHRWIRIGPLAIHVASLVIPLVLIELDRILRDARLAVAFGVMFTTATALAMQPDASQATAFAGAGVVLLTLHVRRKPVAVAGIIALAVVAGLAFWRIDPLAPVAHVEEIAALIGEQGAPWKVAVVVAQALLLLPFIVPTTNASKSPRLAIAVYLALIVLAPYWGHFPVPVLGYGVSAIIGYFIGWTWLRATNTADTTLGTV